MPLAKRQPVAARLALLLEDAPPSRAGRSPRRGPSRSRRALEILELEALSEDRGDLERTSRSSSGSRSIRASTACWIVSGRASDEIPVAPESFRRPSRPAAMPPESRSDRTSSFVKRRVPFGRLVEPLGEVVRDLPPPAASLHEGPVLRRRERPSVNDDEARVVPERLQHLERGGAACRPPSAGSVPTMSVGVGPEPPDDVLERLDRELARRAAPRGRGGAAFPPPIRVRVRAISSKTAVLSSAFRASAGACAPESPLPRPGARRSPRGPGRARGGRRRGRRSRAGRLERPVSFVRK